MPLSRISCHSCCNLCHWSRYFIRFNTTCRLVPWTFQICMLSAFSILCDVSARLELGLTPTPTIELTWFAGTVWWGATDVASRACSSGWQQGAKVATLRPGATRPSTMSHRKLKSRPRWSSGRRASACCCCLFRPVYSFLCVVIAMLMIMISTPLPGLVFKVRHIYQVHHSHVSCCCDSSAITHIHIHVQHSHSHSHSHSH